MSSGTAPGNEPNGADTKRVVRTLWALLSPKKRALFGGIVLLLFVAGLMEMTGMVVLFGFVSGLEEHAGHRRGALAKGLHFFFGELPQLDYVLLGGAVVVGLLIVKNLLSSLVHFGLNRFFMKLNESISRRMFEGYLLARFEEFGTRGLAEPMSRVGRAFDVLSSSFSAAAQVLADGAIVTTVALMLLIVEPTITIGGAVLFGGAGFLLHSSTQNLLARLGKQDSLAQSRAKAAISEGFLGLIDGRLNGTRSLFVQSYSKALGASSLAKRRKALITRLPQSINEILLAAAIVGTVLYLTLGGFSIKEALPTLTIFAFAGLRLTAAMSRIAKGLQTIRQRSFEFSRVEEEISVVAPEVFHDRIRRETVPRYIDLEAPPLPLEFHEAIELRNVSFTYPETTTPVLENISLTIRKGEFFSLCGPSGGGKSTLLLLIMGILTPTSGTILVDGVAITDRIQAWHAKLGYVGQHPFISSTTVRENVAFAQRPEDVDDSRVWEALEQAQAADFVRGFRSGLDRGLRDGGIRISGGQRQRLVIARALYKNPEVLIFDEATAALDNLTEKEITRAIVNLSRKKTILCVAHRLTTIQQSDRICLVANRSIQASGTYDELLESSADFRALAHAGKTKV